MILSSIATMMEESTPPSINDNCRYHYQVAACDACLSSCPAKAINLEQQIISDDLCYRCGQCVEVCQYQAIDNITLPKRTIVDKRIQLSNNEVLSIKELYSWSQAQPQLKGITTNQKNEALQEQVEQLNQLLEKQNLLKWTIVIEKRLDLSKRRLFSFAKQQETSSQLTPDQLKTSEQFMIHLDKQRCSSCLVCMRTCPKPVFNLVDQENNVDQQTDEARLTVDATECHGCNSCVELCPQNAIAIVNSNLEKEKVGKEKAEDLRSKITSYPLIKQTCQQCHQAFLSIKPQSQCFICHAKPQLGMKES